MRIGILTVPFNNNYGGFLQAFALKKVLSAMGHEVVFVMRRRNMRKGSFFSFLKYFLSFGKRGYCRYFYDRKVGRLSVHTKLFESQYLYPWTKEYYDSDSIKELKSSNIDIFIAGSDQCWRAKFAPEYIDDYFFSFLKGSEKNSLCCIVWNF